MKPVSGARGLRRLLFASVFIALLRAVSSREAAAAPPPPPMADLALMKSAPSGTTLGSQLTYTITVRNLGPSDASNVVVTDDLPASLSFDSCSSDGGGVCGGTGNTRTVTFPALANGASATIFLTGTVKCSAGIGTISNTATVAATSPGDPDLANNSAGADTSIIPLPPPPPPPIPIDAPTAVGAGSPGHVASAPNQPNTVYTWSIGNGTITAGQGTSRITFTAGIPGTLTLGVSAPIVGTCFTTQGFASVSVVEAGSASLFYAVAPCRIIDTRGPGGPLGGPALEPSGRPDRIFTVTGSCAVPPEATSLSVNMTVTNAAAAGSLQVYQGDGSPGAAEAISFPAGPSRANNALVRLATDGSGTIRVRNNSPGTVDFILDVGGYFQ